MLGFMLLIEGLILPPDLCAYHQMCSKSLLIEGLATVSAPICYSGEMLPLS